MAEKDLPATSAQHRRFQERGEIPRSRELTMAMVLMASFAVAMPVATYSARPLKEVFMRTLGNLGAPVDEALIGLLLQVFLMASLPLMLIAVLAAVGTGLLQSKGDIPWGVVNLDLQRLDPFPKLKQMFASVESWTSLFLATLKVVAVGAACTFALWQHAPRLLLQAPASLGNRLEVTGRLLFGLCVAALVTMVVLAVVDYMVNYFRLQKRMLMSHEEVREDVKQEMGDPQVRQRRRRKQMELARQRSLREVPKGDVVLVNPTRFAVVIQYRSDTQRAPKVIAKGAGRMAEKIRQIARRAGVPIISKPPLTRLLFRRVPVGKEIPKDLYQAVAVILAFVYRKRRSAV